METPVPTPEEIRSILAEKRDGPIEVSIVIPAHNEAASIQQCLASIAEAVGHTKRAVEVICICNACTDNTAAIASSCGARVIEEPQKGVSIARQTGHTVAQGSVILMTDADTRVPPTWIDAHADHYQQDEVVGVGGDMAYDGAHFLFRAYSAATALFRAIVRFVKPMVGASRQPLTFSGANSSYRKKSADAVGGFEPGLNQGEDTLLGRKLQTIGTIIRDTSDEIRVLTSGRRVATFRKALAYILRRIPRALRAYLFGGGTKPEADFDDIRE